MDLIPIELEPVLALISHQSDLGHSESALTIITVVENAEKKTWLKLQTIQKHDKEIFEFQKVVIINFQFNSI